MKKIFILAISSFVLWSCNDTTKKTVVTDESETHAPSQEHYNESSDALGLNDGERWVVNEEMKPYVSKQEELLDAYIQTEQTDYEVLAEQLQEQNQLLIQSCTMTGKSHDELHKWLHPYIGLLVELGQAETQDDADRLVSEVNTSFETYHAHFQ